MRDISVDELKERMDKGEPLNIIDVREPWEYEEFNIKGKNMPLSNFMSFIPELEDLKDEEVIVHCKMGGRSMQAAGLLEQMGFTNVKNVTGGMDAWKTRFPG
jgi:rhodanese-related sulfurtransferase